MTSFTGVSSWTDELNDLKTRCLLREFPMPGEAPGPTVRLGDREMLCFSSNNYLGLARHPRVIATARAALDETGCGATGSRLLSGNLSIHERLESRLANFKGSGAALLFGTGFAANTGVLTALARGGDLLVCDKLNHASLIDGARASGAEFRHFRHGDMTRARQLLSTSKARRRFLVSDGVFSMNGKIAILSELLELAERYEAFLILDEAHATGVIGASGRGTFEHFDLNLPEWQRRLPGVIQTGTLGKALGGFGAFVISSPTIREVLVNKARPLIFSTALPPAVCGAAIGALDTLVDEPGLLARLRKNVSIFRGGLRSAGFLVDLSGTPIIPIVTNDAQKALQASLNLAKRGIRCLAVRPPAVPPNYSGLRVTITAAHTQIQLEYAIEAFSAIGRELGAIP